MVSIDFYTNDSNELKAYFAHGLNKTFLSISHSVGFLMNS